MRGRGDGPCGRTRSLRGGEREEKGHQGQRHGSQHPRSVLGESRGQAAWCAGREGPLPVRLGLQTCGLAFQAEEFNADTVLTDPIS